MLYSVIALALAVLALSGYVISLWIKEIQWDGNTYDDRLEEFIEDIYLNQL